MLGSSPAAGPLAGPGLHRLRVDHLGPDGHRPGTLLLGPARQAPGPSDDRPGAGFASGEVLDRARPGPVLAAAADVAAGPSRGYAGVSDDELVGVLIGLAADRIVGGRRAAVGGGGAGPAASGHRACPCGACRGAGAVGQVLRG